ncbi:helix-turn-helix transcriptional regulator [Pedobacter sp. SYSU D00535]|uniref:helix-turn-helix domain-containing protein n=1 Tax=Pedobacter sp. SYSU D00535 TaxID=2810308 RepID=UPI001A96E16D|nr:helix-turn-helix transcriptional regulator [Pedobacter sp. SYSU D00535]
MNTGEIVELVIRRDNVSISELSRKLRVSRRSIYNWFNRQHLSKDVICKIGDVLGHDFSAELPEVFNNNNSEHNVSYPDLDEADVSDKPDSAQYWRTKYIKLLEKHNDYLSRRSVQ